MNILPPVLQRISDGLELTREDCRLSTAIYDVANRDAVVLRAETPFGDDDRAIFFADLDDCDVLHAALATGWGSCALGLPVPEFKVLPDFITSWEPRYLRPEWWRTVRLSTSLLVTLVDVPADPEMPLRDLLDDFSFLSNLQQHLVYRAKVADFSWADDPYGPYLYSFDFGTFDTFMPIYEPVEDAGFDNAAKKELLGVRPT